MLDSGGRDRLFAQPVPPRCEAQVHDAPVLRVGALGDQPPLLQYTQALGHRAARSAQEISDCGRGIAVAIAVAQILEGLELDGLESREPFAGFRQEKAAQMHQGVVNGLGAHRSDDIESK